MSLSRAVVLSAIFFMLGTVVYSLMGFSWWLAIFLLLSMLSFGLVSALESVAKFSVIFLVFLSLFLGFIRAATYTPSLAAEEQTFWHETRGYLVKRIIDILPNPESAVFSAMVFGYEKDIPISLKTDFNRTGTRHILAISGMNISIVAMMLLNFGLLIGLWRRQAFWLAIAGIIIFILLAGSPASAVRAGLMSGLLLWAKNKGRLVLAWRPVILAAFFMVVADPTLLISGVGFQLSFLAVVGIIYFKDFWDKILGWIRFKFLRDLVSLSMAAQITTWPIILYNFGTFSTVSPIANIFVVPLLTPIMFLGLGFAVVSWSALLAQIFLWPAWLILRITDKLVVFFSSLPGASLQAGKVGVVLLLVYYPFLIWFWKFLEKRNLNVATL